MLLAFIGGIFLGFLFFYSLDFGIKGSEKFKNSSLFIFLASLIRIIVLLVGFYYLSQNSGRNFFAALVGALASRIYIVYFYRKNRK
ncbi:N-ATPase subunit AtpR [Cetobacterium sp.]|uniref:N-ATPase subunit AtpR n=1 Tax=Cetobacterium sp. TaxID=2071632 RepID=UPI003F2E2D59